MEQSKSNISKYGWAAFKLLLAVFAFWFVYKKLMEQKDAHGYLEQMKIAFHSGDSLFLLLLVLVLMFFNWLTEAVKWKKMIDHLEKISLFRSLEAVCSGLTVSIFTPNRIGEYAGRVFHLKEANKIQATIVTVIENCSQLLATLVAGSLASAFYLFRYSGLPFSVSFIICISLFVITTVGLLSFFNIRLMENLIRRMKFNEKWQKTFHVLSEYTFNELFSVFLLALVRYLIFVFQFYLLIKIYGGSGSLFESAVMIAMTYLVITIVPSMALVELGVRGAAAAYFFSKITLDLVPVMNAVFSLWVINLALPAFAGALFMLNFRLGKSGKE